MKNSKSGSLDLHKAEASKIFNVAEDAVTPEQRRYAKTMAFANIYGTPSQQLVEKLNNLKKAEYDSN